MIPEYQNSNQDVDGNIRKNQIRGLEKRMMVVLENPAITTLNTAYLPAIKDNNELLRDMILYYESQIWSKTDPGQRIENYLSTISQFRKKEILSQTKNVFKEIISRLKTAGSYISKDTSDKIGALKKLALTIFGQWKKDKCKKFDERVTEKQISDILSKSESVGCGYFLSRYSRIRKKKKNIVLKDQKAKICRSVISYLTDLKMPLKGAIRGNRTPRGEDHGPHSSSASKTRRLDSTAHRDLKLELQSAARKLSDSLERDHSIRKRSGIINEETDMMIPDPTKKLKVAPDTDATSNEAYEPRAEFYKFTSDDGKARLLNVLVMLKYQGISYRELPTVEDDQVMICFTANEFPEKKELHLKIVIEDEADKCYVRVEKSKDFQKIYKHSAIYVDKPFDESLKKLVLFWNQNIF